jgi:hypothetical protein
MKLGNSILKTSIQNLSDENFDFYNSLVLMGSGNKDKHKTLDDLGFARKVHLATIPRESPTL